MKRNEKKYPNINIFTKFFWGEKFSTIPGIEWCDIKTKREFPIITVIFDKSNLGISLNLAAPFFTIE